MKKHLLWLASSALVLSACSDEVLDQKEASEEESSNIEQTVSNLKHASLKSISSSGSRFRAVAGTRADEEEGPLTLIAEIDNISEQIDGFEKESRLLSATSVFYDAAKDVYYATYHMQGNNYHTTQTNETGGYIESFTIGDDGRPVAGNIYFAANPAEISFDFNHLYFDRHVNETNDYYFQFIGDYTVDDDMASRLIAVGHSSTPSSKENGKPNTEAIIAQLDLDNNSLIYQTVLTGEKILDADGRSLGDEDAQDVNCVVRKYNHYYLATRKGIASLKAGKNVLFDPELDKDGNIYFLKTPGSVKHISQPTFSSGVDFIYLTQDHPDDMTYATESPVIIMRNAINNYFRNEWVDYPVGIESVKDFNWQSGSTWPKISEPINSISPVDGKNMFFTGSLNTAAEFICLGRNGLYINNPTSNWANPQNNIITFSDTEEGSRPVNGVFVEDWDEANGHHYTDGFIYVCNGACLTILDYYTLEKVAEYSAFKDYDYPVSANFVHVVKTNNYPTSQYVPERIITVAYGQAGVKVFRFVPPVK